MNAADPSQLVGSVVADRYRVQDCLGSGTMGAVYRAEHIHMKKTVALKVLHPSHTRDPEVVERFQREAQAAANIEHPNICAATDFGKLDQYFYYLVMEYLEGRALIDLIKAGETFPPLRALHIGIQMLSALEKAHEMGVVHRDLKPENIIIVEREGDPDFVKITDFGVAQVRMFKDAARLTQAGVVYGSPLYMSPQQASGKEIDHRADLYSVGVMLYELLTGKLPFYAKSLMVVLNMHIADPPPPFVEANPSAHIPPELEAVVMRLLAKEPGERYQTAVEVREELERIRDSLLAPAEEPAAEPSPAARRLMAGMILLFAALVVSWGAFLVGKVVFGGAEVQAARSDREEMKFTENEINRTETDRSQWVKSTPRVQDALAQLDNDPQMAVADFESIRAAAPDNPHAQFLLGRAHSAAQNWDEAFAAYQKTIEMDPDYVRDSQLQDDIMSGLESSDDAHSDPAEKLVKAAIGPAMNIRLAELAEHHKILKIRKRALRILQESGQFQNLPDWNQLTIQLRHAVGCEDNHAWIMKIADLGDPRALGALRRFSALPKTGCGPKKAEDCYECLRYDLRLAIERLQSTPVAPEPVVQ